MPRGKFLPAVFTFMVFLVITFFTAILRGNAV